MARGRDGKITSDAEPIGRVLRRTVKAYERWPNFYRPVAPFEVTCDAKARGVCQTFSEGCGSLMATVLVDTDADCGAGRADVVVIAGQRTWQMVGRRGEG